MEGDVRRFAGQSAILGRWLRETGPGVETAVIPKRNSADRIAVAMSVGRDGRVDGWATAGGKLGYLVIGPRAWPMARGTDNHPFGPNGTGPDGSVRDGSGRTFGP